jgi:uncharacterized protein YbjT (DUF2867 family)
VSGAGSDPARIPEIETRRLLIFVTGATGYIGGRLVPRLLAAGHRVRCYVRSPRKLDQRHWSHHPMVEIISGDADDEVRLRRALRGCHVAYYLIHSMMNAGVEFEERDRQLASRFAAAADLVRVERIIYLGGLGEVGKDLSKHLASRREVEAALSARATPVTSFRACMIIGSGSASFEILRYLVDRLPIMLTPSWVRTECQPISVRNTLHYLVECLSIPETTGRTLDIGGPDKLTYRDLIGQMARSLDHKRIIVAPLPFAVTGLSSLLIHLMTPVSYRMVRPLTEGLRNRVVCRNDEAASLMPQRLLSVREAIDAALGKIADHDVETSWIDSGIIPGDPDWAGGTVYKDTRKLWVDATSERVFHTVCSIGGRQGWYSAKWLWQLRGFLDRLLGGPGLERGRRDPEHVGYGDALDFWRVTEVRENRHLGLRGEFKLPGEALLEFEIQPRLGTGGGCLLTQTARFKPKGLRGRLYWLSVLPFHGFVFSHMIRGLKQESERSG